jgi:hypothetical protein
MKRIKTVLLSGVVAVGLFAIIGASPALAAKKPGGGTTSASCPGPKSTANLPTYDNAGAYATPISGGFDYFFTSTDQDPSGGVPGLVKYCVYPSDAKTAPDVADATYNNWVASTSPKSPYPFSFGRNGGNETNVPLDGNNPVKIGTATWDPSTDAPSLAGQTIVLHIADPDFCGTSPTCFVKPALDPCATGAGSSDFGYNAIPFGVFDGVCGSVPSLGFEAQSVSEFGDEVVLDTTSGTKLKSLTVDFQSFGCSDSGHWFSSNCVTTPGETFTIPQQGTVQGITARIYDADDPNLAPGGIAATPIATGTNTDPIPFRPTADATCPAADVPAGSKFRNAGGVCVNSLTVPITFNLDSGTVAVPAGGEVVWTVAFNTTGSGYAPFGALDCRTQGAGAFPDGAGNPGCGYDSLNVGVKSYALAPYAGTDVVEDQAWRNGGTDPSTLAVETGWTGFRPLGQITLGN